MPDQYAFSQRRVGPQVSEPAERTPEWGEVYRKAPNERSRLDTLMEYVNAPQNQWFGSPGKFVQGAESLPLILGGLGRMFNTEQGWKVLREYIEKGGTPQSLRELLRARGYPFEATDAISTAVRQGTDLAAPPGLGAEAVRRSARSENIGAQVFRDRYPESMINELSSPEQKGRLDFASRVMKVQDPSRLNARPSYTRAGQVTEEGALGEIPSGTLGQGAYNAISSRMAKMMEDPNFLAVRKYFQAPPVTNAEYYKEFPIHRGEINWLDTPPFTPEVQRANIVRGLGHSASARAEAERRSSELVDRAIDAGEAGNHEEADRLMRESQRVLGLEGY